MAEEAKISMSEHNDILHELRIDYEKIIKEKDLKIENKNKEIEFYKEIIKSILHIR